MERAPATGPLAAVVENFWCIQWALPAGRTYEQDVVTDPCGHLTVEDGLAWVRGVVGHRFRRRLVGAGRVVGAKLRPAGLGALTAVPPASLVDRRVPATEVLGDVGDLVEAVDEAPDAGAAMAAVERWLAARGPVPPEGAALVDEAVALATRDRELTRVADLAAALGVPVRTLQRRFDRHLGVGPKWVLQPVPDPGRAGRDRGRRHGRLGRPGDPARVRRPVALREQLHRAGGRAARPVPPAQHW